MSNAGTLILSKVIDENNVNALAKHNVTSTHFKSEADRKAHDFIVEYSERNGGQAPSYATVTDNVPDFFYVPDVSDSYEYLTRRLYNDAGLTEFAEFVSGGTIQTLFNEHKNDVPALIDKLQSELDNIRKRTSVREKVGTDIKTDTDVYLAEYDRRKSGQSFKTWKSKFSHIGEYVSGNMYVVYGKSGRGKSVIAMEEAVEAATQGANVLIWSMEMPKFEIMTRIYVALSGRKGLTVASLNGVDMSAGFDANDVRKGRLADEFEIAYRAFLDNLNSELAGNITVRAVDDDDFDTRTVAQIKSDIIATEADFVVIDPTYYLDLEKNTSKTTGGDAAATSLKLRRITGQMGVVTIAITQADEKDTAHTEDGTRELELPQRKDVSKTKQLLQDAYLLIAVDTDYKQARGLVGLNKGRDGGEGDFVEIVYAPQVGIVKQIRTGADSVDQFDF